MRKIILMMSISLDGYFEAPGHDLTWQKVDEELHGHFNEWLGAAGGFLDGRVTYELMASYWPTADQDPDASAPVAEFAAIWRDMPKIVYSRTLQNADWNTTIVREIDADAVRALQEQPGADLVLGGADLADEFLRQGLLDGMRLYVHPVLIGHGTPLFREGVRGEFVLEQTRTFSNGVVMLHYVRER